MSRRARLEEEKLRQLNEELEEEENRIKAQIERIYAPIVWKRLNSGIRIEDLKPTYYDEVLKIIQECYFQEEVLCRNTNLADDPESVQSFKEHVLFNLKDRTSIIAIAEVPVVEEQEEEEEKTKDKVKKDGKDETEKEVKMREEVAGFLVLKAVHQNDFGSVFSRVMRGGGEAFKTCSTFLSFLGRKADVYGEFNCQIFLRYCLVCVKPEYRKRNLGFQLMSAGIDVARSLEIPVIMGLFSCFSLQKRAKRLGMKVIFKIDYVRWCDRLKELIFEDPGVGNYSCAVMAGPVPPPPTYKPPLPPPQEPVKLTRDEKRKALAKAAKKKG